MRKPHASPKPSRPTRAASFALQDAGIRRVYPAAKSVAQLRAAPSLAERAAAERTLRMQHNGVRLRVRSVRQKTLHVMRARELTCRAD